MNAQHTAQINKFIKNKDMPALECYLSELNDTITFDTDLFYIFFIVNIIKAEIEAGESGLIENYSDISEILSVLKNFRRMVRRFEWCEESDRNEILIYMSRNHLSAYLLYWVIETCCVDSGRVWRYIKNE